MSPYGVHEPQWVKHVTRHLSDMSKPCIWKVMDFFSYVLLQLTSIKWDILNCVLRWHLHKRVTACRWNQHNKAILIIPDLIFIFTIFFSTITNNHFVIKINWCNAVTRHVSAPIISYVNMVIYFLTLFVWFVCWSSVAHGWCQSAV